MIRKQELRRFHTSHVGKDVHCIIIDQNNTIYKCEANALYDTLVNEYGTLTAETMMYHESFFASEEVVREIAHTQWMLTAAGSMLKLK